MKTSSPTAEGTARRARTLRSQEVGLHEDEKDEGRERRDGHPEALPEGAASEDATEGEAGDEDERHGQRDRRPGRHGEARPPRYVPSVELEPQAPEGCEDGEEPCPTPHPPEADPRGQQDEGEDEGDAEDPQKQARGGLRDDQIEKRDTENREAYEDYRREAREDDEDRQNRDAERPMEGGGRGGCHGTMQYGV